MLKFIIIVDLVQWELNTYAWKSIAAKKNVLRKAVELELEKTIKRNEDPEQNYDDQKSWMGGFR